MYSRFVSGTYIPFALFADSLVCWLARFFWHTRAHRGWHCMAKSPYGVISATCISLSRIIALSSRLYHELSARPLVVLDVDRGVKY